MEGFNDRAQLETALDYADFDPGKPYLSKRRDAYVTEHYFEQDILHKVAEGGTTLGWCYITLGNHRYWFKSVSTLDYPEKERSVDKAFISKAMSHDSSQKFFLVTLKESEIGAYHIATLNDEWFLEDIRKEKSHQWFAAKVAEMNQHARRLLSKPILETPFCSQWMGHVSDEYLTALLIQRILMNVGLAEHYPLDIDAIEIDKSSLVFHEFKRKDPCPNGFFTIEKGKRGLTELYRIRKDIRASKAENDDALFEFIQNDLNISRAENTSGYGLDLSHVSNFSYCVRKNIIYRHTIWDSQNYPRKPNISDLFSRKPIEPKKDNHILFRDLDSEDFAGFIFTSGANSGTIHQNPRMQFVLDASLFHTVKTTDHKDHL